MLNRFATLAATSLFALVASSFPANAAPEAKLWERWTAHDAVSDVMVNHSAWDTLLKKYVKPGKDGVHRMHYEALRTTDRKRLEGYITHLSNVPVSRCARSEQLAYWINLYNALTVKVIVDHYPVKSIRDVDISPGLFSGGPWGKKLIAVEGEMLSLDDIEHRVLRPIWKDPRIHYAVNCASIGCPDLMSKAYTAANVQKLLDDGARRYVNHPRGAEVKGGHLTVSSIYKWFKVDFGGDDQGVIAHLKKYAEPPLRDALASISSIDDDRYDWSLNDL